MDEILSSLLLFRRRLPLPVRMAYGWIRRRLVPHPIWDNDTFKKYSRWLQETQWWSKDQLEALQLEQLRALVQHAYESVPYYRGIFDEQGLKPEDISSLNDLPKIPFLTKEIVRDNQEDLIARNIDREQMQYVTTSGSTGRPLGFYHDKRTAAPRENAFSLRQWSWAGYRFGDRIVTLRANLLIMAKETNKRFWWDFNTDWNELVLSSMDMSEENMHLYVEKIKEFKPKFINAIPSSLEILARFMKRNGLGGINVQAIFCESETLFPGQREFMELQFKCKIFAGYGQAEFVADATECDRHEGYHVNMEYGILELIDADGQPITKPDELGRVVGTGFDPYCMPFIRYATDDLAVYASEECSCGRHSVLMHDFKGRIGEYVVSMTGQLVPYCVLEGGHTHVWSKIRELMFIQERKGELTIQIARAPSFSEVEIEREFLEELYKRLDREHFNINIVFDDRVPRTSTGKIRSLEQKLPISVGDICRVEGDMVEKEDEH